MLEEKTIKESLEIESGKVYATFSLKETKRLVNGCEARKELANQILEKRKELEEVNKTRDKVMSELTALLNLDNKLVGIGCCNLSKPVYKAIDGIIQRDINGNPIVDHYTHDEYCTHKED